jgi:hypothetical protein
MDAFRRSRLREMKPFDRNCQRTTERVWQIAQSVVIYIGVCFGLKAPVTRNLRYAYVSLPIYADFWGALNRATGYFHVIMTGDVSKVRSDILWLALLLPTRGNFSLVLLRFLRLADLLATDCVSGKRCHGYGHLSNHSCLRFQFGRKVSRHATTISRN